jgi:hypothetical protein
MNASTSAVASLGWAGLGWVPPVSPPPVEPRACSLRPAAEPLQIAPDAGWTSVNLLHEFYMKAQILKKHWLQTFDDACIEDVEDDMTWQCRIHFETLLLVICMIPCKS